MELANEAAERRTHPRHDVDVAGRYWIDDDRAAVPCELVDVSLGGARIELPRWAWIEPACYVTVELPLPGSPTLMVTTAQVLAVSAGTRRVAHLRFVDESVPFRSFLHAAASQWMPRGADRTSD